MVPRTSGSVPRSLLTSLISLVVCSEKHGLLAFCSSLTLKPAARLKLNGLKDETNPVYKTLQRTAADQHGCIHSFSAPAPLSYPRWV